MAKENITIVRITQSTDCYGDTCDVGFPFVYTPYIKPLRCSYCGNIFRMDARGGCIACGGSPDYDDSV